MDLNDAGEVRAAGGAVVRAGDDGGVDVLLVHRPHYDDWTFPKGKAEPGESDEECALREVREETGLRCELHEELPSIRYIDRKGRPKVSRYWRMTVVDGTFEPHAEVDAVRWVRVEDARSLLTYDRDVDLVNALGA